MTNFAFTSLVGAIFAISLTAAKAESTQEERLALTKEAMTAWSECLDFEVQSNVRSMGDSMSGEQLADLTLASCGEMELIAKDRLVNTYTHPQIRDDAEMLFMKTRRDFHAIYADQARALMQK